MGALPRISGVRRVPLAALIVALVALVIPTIGVFASVEFAGWQTGHGHIGMAAAVAHDSHPYDDHTDQSGDVASDIVFIPSDDGSVASALTPTHALLELTFVASGAAHPSSLDQALAPAGTQPSVPVPPPRA